MDKLGRDEIEKIGNCILSESDIVATHGTSIENAQNIMNTGFRFNRTSMIFQGDNVVNLCTYGWKENPVGDAANVVISIPKDFFKQLLDIDNTAYLDWVNNIENKDSIIYSVCDIVANGSIFRAIVPSEFIRGMFVYTDNKNYLSFANMKDGMDYLTYFDNPNYFNNLNEEEKTNFVNNMKQKIMSSTTRTK